MLPNALERERERRQQPQQQQGHSWFGYNSTVVIYACQMEHNSPQAADMAAHPQASFLANSPPVTALSSPNTLVIALATLLLAATDEHKLQIIFATIEVQAATSAWSLQHSIVRYNPVTSPLLHDLLESLRTTSHIS